MSVNVTNIEKKKELKNKENVPLGLRPLAPTWLLLTGRVAMATRIPVDRIEMRDGERTESNPSPEA